VPVSTRTMKFTVFPSEVVVFATSAGSGAPAASGFSVFGSAVERYTCWTTVFTEQLASSGGPSFDPSGSVKSFVWQTNGWSHGPDTTGPSIG
jgi:hypothetical protein